MLRYAFAAAATLAGGLALANCSGTPGTVLVTPAPVITPTPTPAMIVVTPGNASFTTLGATAGFTASESGYTGTISQTNNCAGIATVTPSSGTGPSAAFTVTSTGAGSCQISAKDANNQIAVFNVNVTSSVGTIVLSPQSANFNSAGATAGFTATENGYSGAFTTTNNCAGIATISPTSGSGPSQPFTVTSVGAGSCQFTIKDANNVTALFNVAVTVTSSAAMVTSTSNLNFTAVGSAQQFSVTENGYSGTFSAANGAQSCAGIATFAPTSSPGPTAAFTVTAVAAGVCTIKVSDAGGQSAVIQVIVTTTGGSIS